MRKGYGPTGISYPLPLKMFEDECREGITIILEKADVSIDFQSDNLHEITRLYQACDCSVYIDSKEGKRKVYIYD